MSRYTTTLVCLLAVFTLLSSASHEVVEYPVAKEKQCNLGDIKGLTGVKVVACTGLQHNLTVYHKGHCNISIDIPQNESSSILYKGIPESFSVTCVHGHWSGTDTSPPDPRGTPTETTQKPRIEPCPPADIQKVYYVEAGETEMQISWTEPRAYGNNPSLTQVSEKKNGDIFQGSSQGEKYTMMYEANNGLQTFCPFSFRVKVRTCPAAPWVRNGGWKCPPTLLLGASCTYECDDGYRIVGSNIITCVGDNSPQWTQVPTCQEVTCEDNLSVTNGVFICNGNTFRSLCSVDCNEGYRFDGTTVEYTICQMDGSWSPMGVVTCKDSSFPEIYCPHREVFYADKGGNSTSVYWTLPTANDTLDTNPDIVQTAGPDQGAVLYVGSTFVKYKAVDKDGNESPECAIELSVQEITCDHPQSVFTDELLRFDCTSSVLVWGAECELSCVKNLPLNGSTRVTCESHYANSGVPVGYWDIGEGGEPYCKEVSCSEIDPPKNGALVINTVNLRPVYIVMCNENFDISQSIDGFIGMLFCIDSGAWTPIDYAPDCIIPSSDRYLNLKSKMLYYGGTCGTSDTNQEILENLNYLLTNVSQFFMNVCPNGESCSVTNATIICGPVTTRRKRDVLNADRRQEKSVLSADLKRRHERQAISVVMQVEFGIIVGWNPPSNLTLNEQFEHYDKIHLHLKPYMQDLINDGYLDISEDFGFELDRSSFTTADHGDLTCNSGYMLQGTTCYPCPAGHFLGEGSCRRCPLGSYSDTQGLVECIPCPYGLSTRDVGAKNLSQCIRLCNKGYYSADGFVPCSPCGSGSYQNQSGQNECEQCPPGTSTRTQTSSSSQDCEDFDIRLEVTYDEIHIFDIPRRVDNLSLTFWVKRANPVSSSGRLYLTDGTTHFLIVATDETVHVEIHNSSIIDISEISASHWSHIAITMDTFKQELSLYTNGQLARSEAVAFTSDHFIEGPSYLAAQTGGAGGFFISGVQMKPYPFTAEEIEALASSCQAGSHGDDIINMNTFSRINKPGISRIIPSVCDPVDGCASRPCGNHTCVSRDSEYTCVCSNDMTGRHCDVPLDHCINITCANGGTCTSKAGGFTCMCLPGYKGSLCEVPPVAGQWSEWFEWSQCSTSCGSGVRMRARSCTEPPPDPFGAACPGANSSEESCNQEICRECPELKRHLNTRINCSTDSGSGLKICTLSCLDWEAFPPGIDGDTFVNYRCGPTTNYTWVNTSNTPSCVPYNPPRRVEIKTVVRFQEIIPSSAHSTVISSVHHKALVTPCFNSGRCSMNVSLDEEPTRKRRSTQSTLTIRFEIQLTETSDLQLESFLENQTVSASLREVGEAIYNLEATAVYINESAADIFDTTVDGNTYTSESDSLYVDAVVSCSNGQTSKEGLCTECPAGTFVNNNVCSFCDVGTYQPESGQTSCIDCPPGYTTRLIGSDSISQCTEADSVHGEPLGEESDDPDLTSVIVGIVVGTTVLITVILLGCVLYKAQKNKSQRIGCFVYSKDRGLDYDITSNEAHNDRNSRPTLGHKSVSDFSVSELMYQPDQVIAPSYQFE